MLGASEPLQNGVTRDPSSVKRKPGFAGMSSAVFSARPIIDLFKVGSHGRKSPCRDRLLPTGSSTGNKSYHLHSSAGCPLTRVRLRQILMS